MALAPFEPAVARLPERLEPWEACQRLGDLPYRIFLDSAARDGLQGRWSYVAASPPEVLVVRSLRLERLQADPTAGLSPTYQPLPGDHGDIWQAIEERLASWSAKRLPGLPPFQGGAAGYLGYELARSLEMIPAPRRDEFGLPDMVLGIYDWVLAFDHRSGEAWCISTGFPEEDPQRRRSRAKERLQAAIERLDGGGRGAGADAPARAPSLPQLERCDISPAFAVPGMPGLLSDFTPEGYLRAVERAIEYIRAGDIFQVNLSQRLLYPAELPPLELYGRLRERNPAAFAGLFDFAEGWLVSSSPEAFLSLDDGRISTRPIKGTRPRGYTPESDSWGREALRESEKDRAENVMIVDLLRNDLSRVSLPGSVQVPRLFETELHPTVHHLVSEVVGELRPGLGAMDLLRATFPGGSITGAPKIRAMEIIAELEPTARGPYCGCLGWIAFHGGLCLNISIRTVISARGWLQLPVGGGVVALSHPGVEYQETLHKASGMLRALRES